MSGFSGEEKRCSGYSMSVKPTKKKKMYFSQRALEYSAFINYYLVLLKLKDDVADDNSKKKALIYHVLKRNKTFQNMIN